MKASGAPVIFDEAGHSSADAEALAKQLGDGVKVAELFTGGIQKDDPRFTSYAALVRTNVRLVTDALKSESDKLKRNDSGHK